METRSTLLGRLGDPGNEAGWEEFFTIYNEYILQLAMVNGLDNTAAKDVLQDTMVCLMRTFQKGFGYSRKKGSFRGFLKVMVKRRVVDHLRRHGKYVLVEEEETLDFLDEEPGDDLEKAWRWSIVQQCLLDMWEEKSFSESHLRVFEAYSIEGIPAKTVSEMCGVTPNNIYQIHKRIMEELKTRVNKSLREESS